MGCLRPYGCSPNIDDCSFTCGGDCEAIEQYVLDMACHYPIAKLIKKMIIAYFCAFYLILSPKEQCMSLFVQPFWEIQMQDYEYEDCRCKNGNVNCLKNYWRSI